MTTKTLFSYLPKSLKSFSIRGFFLLIAVKLAQMLSRFQKARMIAQQRRSLAHLDSAQLRDIGISRNQADVEASRGFWDIPENLK